MRGLYLVLALAASLLVADLPIRVHLPIASAAEDPEFVGAGDIASCGSSNPATTRAEATAKLLDGIVGTVFTLGDNAYQSGTAAEYQNCYAPTWGRHKARTRPAPGNHDYITAGAGPYYSYFGENAGPAGRGYYSYTVGTWHVVSLNSEIDASATSPQAQWLREDLAANPATCTVAYWHKPLFSSGEHGNYGGVRALWDILYQQGVDVVLNGHDHNYERFAPQNPAGQADPSGIHAFVVGTGGISQRAFGTIRPNSVVRSTNTWGVLKLTLRPTSFAWDFVPIAGQSFDDSGSADCVGASSTPSATPVTPSATPVTPSATPVTPSATPVTPSATAVTPSATAVTPSATAVTPSATAAPATPTATPTSGQTVQTFLCNLDTQASALNPTTNYGRSTSISVDGGSDQIEGFVRFSLPSLTQRIVKAELRLYITTNGTTNGPEVYGTSSGWSETGLTWNNRPAATTAMVADSGTLTKGQWVTWDVTTLVSGASPVSFLLRADSDDGVKFSSRQGSRPPQLVLTLAP